MLNLGGNIVSKINLANSGTTVFADSPYYYGIHQASAEGELSIPDLQSMTIYALKIPDSVVVFENITQKELFHGDCIQVNHHRAQVILRSSGDCAFLIAGVNQSNLQPSIELIKAKDIKKVIKPWGHELWISGEHPEFALKQVFIRAPYKTSLQYHDFKHETIVLFSGSAKLHHKRDESLPNLSVGESDLTFTELSPVSVALIKPPALHRFEACSDLTLYEASTPHLHDVIRVSDDSNRPNGRIESEHTVK
jgi:hypothetical protein